MISLNLSNNREQIGFIGHFGAGVSLYDGQTIKTRTLESAIIKYTTENIDVVRADTYYLKKNPFKFIYELLKCIITCKKIIIILSKNGRRFLFPLMYLLTKSFHKEVYHCVIGGKFSKEISDRKYLKYINSFVVNWVESDKMRSALSSSGVVNAEVLPNFKEFSSETPRELNEDVLLSPLRFCMFSRVMKEKGIEDAIAAVTQINSMKPQIALDIYGPVQEGYEDEFFALINESDGLISYCGCVQPGKSIQVLNNYFMLLFPTYWRGEGIPGTIIDALTAGLPVIARKWTYCDEMLIDGITGYCYPFDQPELLTSVIEKAIENKNQVYAMRPNCVRLSSQYSAKNAIGIVLEKLSLSKQKQ